MERDNRPKIELKKMPDKETLEEFLNGMHSTPKVVFNIETGELEWIDKNDRPINTNTSQK